jgi:hypothetical protein
VGDEARGAGEVAVGRGGPVLVDVAVRGPAPGAVRRGQPHAHGRPRGEVGQQGLEEARRGEAELADARHRREAERGDEHQAGHAVGGAERRLERDLAAERVAEEHGAADA